DGRSRHRASRVSRVDRGWTRRRHIGHPFSHARTSDRARSRPGGERGPRRRTVDRHSWPTGAGARRRNSVLPEEEGGVRVNPDDLHYTQSHEWVRVDGEVGTIGITEHAQKELGEIVYLELPEVGHVYDADSEFGTVESVKAVSELYTPVSG